MKKNILLIIGILIILISIPLSVYLVRQRQEFAKRAVPATVLSLSPASLNKEVGENFIINILIESGENQVVSADIDLNFNPAVLNALSVTAATFFSSPTEPTNIIDNDTGKIMYSLFTTTPQQGQGILASITFQGKAEGISQVNFENTTTVGSLGETEALEQVIPGTYTIAAPVTAPTATPTPTPAVGGGEIPTTTPTPTSAPGITSTPTPTPQSQGGSVIPTSSPTPTPTTAVASGETPTPTPLESLPETGILGPTIIFSLFGLLILVFGLSLGIFLFT